jgi:hypothetical protein
MRNEYEFYVYSFAEGDQQRGLETGHHPLNISSFIIWIAFCIPGSIVRSFKKE